MIFTELDVEGAFVVDLERRQDERGFFARAFCTDEFAAYGLDPKVVQASISSNERGDRPWPALAGAARARGQDDPLHRRRGLRRRRRRRGSSTHSRWAGVELSGKNQRALYVPPGCAHGLMALTDGATLFYLVSQAYSPSHERARWDDPAFGIDWPDPGVPVVLSPKDASWPDYTEDQAVAGLL